MENDEDRVARIVEENSRNTVVANRAAMDDFAARLARSGRDAVEGSSAVIDDSLGGRLTFGVVDVVGKDSEVEIVDVVRDLTVDYHHQVGERWTVGLYHEQQVTPTDRVEEPESLEEAAARLNLPAEELRAYVHDAVGAIEVGTARWGSLASEQNAAEWAARADERTATELSSARSASFPTRPGSAVGQPSQTRTTDTRPRAQTRQGPDVAR